MGRYAYFTCTKCKVAVYLGKALYNNLEQGAQPSSFHEHSDLKILNSENITLNKVIHKMFADHANHQLRVFIDDALDIMEMDDYTMITSDAETDQDITIAEYIKGWNG
jgi:hypothetical protein